MTMSVGSGSADGTPSGLGGTQPALMNQLSIFLEGAGKERGGNLRLSSIALNLLKNLPGARDAVFEYYSGVLDRILKCYNPRSESQSNTEDEAIVGELQEVLSAFVEKNPRSWAPVVSKWSLDTLGQLSYQYEAKMTARVQHTKGDKGKGVEKKGSGTLHEKVSCWLGCVASRFLIEISAECLSKQMDENTEGCISALLETSVNHAPYFDWVVAHLGSCFPHTLIRRVLTLGLKDFITAATTHQGQEGTIQVLKVPKLLSVMNILSHLGRNHQTVLQESIHSLVISSLSDGATSANQQAAVPYVLHLAVLSPPLCQALLTGLVDQAVPDVVRRVAMLLPAWRGQFFQEENSLLDMLSQIMVSTDRGVPELLVLLLEKGVEDETSDTAKGCRMLFNYVLSALFQQVHGASRHRGDGIPAFNQMNKSISVFLEFLVSEKDVLRSSAVQLLSLYALHKGRSVTVQILKYLLYRSSNDEQLAVLSNFLARVEIFHYNCIPDLIGQSLRNCEGHAAARLLDNLLKLVRVEQKGGHEYRSSFVQGIRANGTVLAEKLMQADLALGALQLFKLVGVERKLRLNVVHRMCHCLVELYFSTMINNQMDFKEREQLLYLTESVTRELCEHRAALQILLRFVLEASINSPYSAYLGSKESEFSGPSSGTPNSRLKETAKLFRENFKFGCMPVQPHGSSTVFHAGVIGEGKRSTLKGLEVCSEQSLVYREKVSGLIMRLCQGQDGGIEGCKKLALILVELVSPDIMYNGIPWPEEEFIRVTMERDIAIARLVERHPILWTLLELLALHKPALCYCSVIVRGIVSVSITHWQSTVSSHLSHFPQQIELTRRVVNLMGSGQFIPPQLSVLSQILHILDPSQLHCILIDIWNYMRVNVPGPSIFQVCENSGVVFRDFGPYEEYKPYCDRLRMVMVGSLEKVAPLFKVYYVDKIKSSTAPIANGTIEHQSPTTNS